MPIAEPINAHFTWASSIMAYPPMVIPGTFPYKECHMTKSNDATNGYVDKCRAVSDAAKIIANIHNLNALKKKCTEDFKQPDWLWRALLVSFSSMGNAKGAQWLSNEALYTHVSNKELYEPVTFDALAKIPASKRRRQLNQALRMAKYVRWTDKKTEWLCSNFLLIAKMGGPMAAKELLLIQQGRDKKINWLEQFYGIGPKYARNIMMDAYHHDFHDSIAIDVRIESITKKLGLDFKNYNEHERFYLNAAHNAGIQGWELDRLIFNFKDEFIKILRTTATRGFPIPLLSE